jgi:hypothetical protein
MIHQISQILILLFSEQQSGCLFFAVETSAVTDWKIVAQKSLACANRLKK